MSINQNSIRAVAAAHTPPHFLRPLYGTYCFSGIPGTVQRLMLPDAPTPVASLPDDVLPLAGKTYDCVVLLFIDAFGWKFFQQHANEFAFLKTLSQNGTASKLTSQFPSTTTAHVSTMHSSLPPAHSGLYEWNQYEPSLDAIITPLMFSFAGERERETLNGVGDPTVIYPQGGMYTRWLHQGVKTTLFQHRDIEPSTFGDALCAGATTRSYKTLAEAVHMLADAINQRKSRHYYHWYYSGFDTLMHQYGPDSIAARAELDVLMHTLNAHLLNALRVPKGSTLLLLTADHGMTRTSPDSNVYINQSMPGLMTWLKRNAQGDVLAPAGSPRDLFLHIKPECMDEAEAHISAALKGKADVRRVASLIAQGYFGMGEPAPRFLQRVGDLVILPYADQSVCWYEKGKFEMNYRGMHGGLSPDEMETPFVAMEI